MANAEFKLNIEDRISPMLGRMTALINALPDGAIAPDSLVREVDIEEFVSVRQEGYTLYCEPTPLAMQTLAELERLVGQ